METKNVKLFSHKIENARSINFALLVPIGSINDPADKMGITHLIEHMTFRRADNMTQKEIYYKSESLGVFIDACTSKNFLQFNFVCRQEVFNEAIQIFSKMFYETNYKEEDLELEKQVVFAEINQRYYHYSEKLINFLWNENKYSNLTLGTHESLKNIYLEDIISFKKKIISNTGMIFLIGNYSEEDLEQVEKLFAPTLNSKTSNSFESNINKKDIAKINFAKEKKDVCDVYYAYHLDISGAERIEKIILIHMLDAILFQGNTAYLNEIMREEKGFVYDFESSIAIINNELIFLFRFEIDKKRIIESIKELEKELAEFIINEKYLKYIKAFFYDNLDMIYDNLNELTDDYIMNYLNFDKIVSPKEYSEIFLNLTIEDYNSFFKELSKEKKVFICGKMNKSQKAEIKANIL